MSQLRVAVEKMLLAGVRLSINDQGDLEVTAPHSLSEVQMAFIRKHKSAFLDQLREDQQFHWSNEPETQKPLVSCGSCQHGDPGTDGDLVYGWHLCRIREQVDVDGKVSGGWGQALRSCDYFVNKS